MSTSAPTPGHHAPEYADLLDDASLIEPPSGAGVASLSDAVSRHRDHLRGGRVGSLVVPDPMLPALAGLPALGSAEQLVVTIAVSGGAGGIEPAAQWASRSPGLTVRTLATTLRDLDDLPGAARRTVAAAQQVLDSVEGLARTSVSVQVPLESTGRPGWLTALDEIAMADLLVAFRTGDAAPAPLVVSAVDAALDREIAMRLTGVHPEVTRGGTSGYRNLLLAVRLTLDGQTDDAEAVLAESEPDRLDALADEVGADALARTRRWLRSVEARPPTSSGA